MMAGFNLNNAMSGLGQGLAEIGGTMHDVAVKKSAEIDLLSIRHQNDLARDQALSRLRVGEHEENARTDLKLYPEKLAAETDAKVKSQDALLPGQLRQKQGESDIAVSEAMRKPRTLSPGSSEVIGSDITVTAPKVPTDPALLKYYEAHARQADASARHMDALSRQGAAKPDKPQFPSIKVEKDDQGRIINLDTNSGAIGVVVPGEDAKPGETHWFKPNEPGKPATPTHIEWSYNGQPLPNGLSDIYPSIRARSGAGPQGGSPASDKPDPLGLSGLLRGGLPGAAARSSAPSVQGPSSAMEAQLNFNADAKTMQPQQLVNTYERFASELKPEQLRMLDEIKNKIPKRALPFGR